MPDDGPPTPPTQATSGVCHLFFAYDVAQAIDLKKAEEILSRQSGMDQGHEEIRVTRRAPAALGYQSRPVKISFPCAGVRVAGLETLARCEVLVFDFGALSVSLRIPLACDLDRLVELGHALYDNPELLDHARVIVERTVAMLSGGAFPAGASARSSAPALPGAALSAGALSRYSLDHAVEDYVVYQLTGPMLGLRPPSAPGDAGVAPPTARELVRRHAQLVAKMLRAERGPMSDEETDEALAMQASYAPSDVVVVDWNAAVIADTSAAPEDGEDVLAVLEYANVELLEMRALDDRLDRAVDEAYAAVVRSPEGEPALAGLLGGFAGLGGARLRAVARLAMDSAVLFEGVNNAIKLVGDQYLARVYRLAARRFHLAERDEAILRKLQTLENMYDKMSSQAAARRLEILEWIVIALIALSLVLPYFTSMH